ncbi:unnamed protein product [Schistosoma turkestanicum]|nr:unnamed protein product [Schistosoma turkestanicum]
MFWSSIASYSRINDLLSRPNLTIQELLDDDDVLQKCREKDPRLVNFLSRSDNLDHLIDLVSRTPLSDGFDLNLYRHSSVACEILTNDINEILDGLVELTPTIVDSSYHTSQNELHHNNNNDNNNSVKFNGTTASCSSSSSPSSMNVTAVSLTEINTDDNNNYHSQNCSNMLIVENNSNIVNNHSSELCQINANHHHHHVDEHGNDDDDDDASHHSPTNHRLNDYNDEDNHHHFNEITSSSLKLFSPISLSTPQSSSSLNSKNDAGEVNSLSTSSTTPTTRRRLDMLIDFFHHSNQPVNPLLACFVSRLLIHLTLHRGSVIIPYLRSSKEFLNHLFSSLDSCSVADLIIQLCQQETKQQHIIFDWFKSDRLIERLIEKFDPTFSFEMHESAAHCLIELINVLRSYLVNNAPNLESSSDMLVDSTTTITSITTDNSISSLPGSPLNNIQCVNSSSLTNDDAITYKSAENFLNILESENTMSLLFDRILLNEYVEPSVLINCVNVFMALIGKSKPESSFVVGEEEPELNCDALIQCFNNININLKSLLRDTTSNDKPYFPADDNTIEKINPPITSSSSSSSANSNQNNNNNNTIIDRLHIMKSSENLIKATLPRLNALHNLLERFHPQYYNEMPTTHCTLNPPLGRCRLTIVQFITTLLSLPIMNSELCRIIINAGFLQTSMKLFSSYPYNTFLHNYVTDMIKSIFKHSGLMNNQNTTNNNNTNNSVVASNQPNQLSTIVDISLNHNNSPSTDSSSSAWTTCSTTTSTTSTAPTSTSTPTTTTTTTTTVTIETNDHLNMIDSKNSSQLLNTSIDQLNSHKQIITTHDNELSKQILISLINEHHLIDWCLALSPLSSTSSNKNETTDDDSSNCASKLTNPPIKFGYSGHVWQIGNIILSASNGPYGEFLKSLIQDLHPKMQNLWSDFVSNLNTVNSVQVTELSQCIIDVLDQSDSSFVLAPPIKSNSPKISHAAWEMYFGTNQNDDDGDDNDGVVNHDDDDADADADDVNIHATNQISYDYFMSTTITTTETNKTTNHSCSSSSLQRKTILQNFLDSWLDPDEEFNNNNSNNSIITNDNEDDDDDDDDHLDTTNQQSINHDKHDKSSSIKVIDDYINTELSMSNYYKCLKHENAVSDKELRKLFLSQTPSLQHYLNRDSDDDNVVDNDNDVDVDGDDDDEVEEDEDDEEEDLKSPIQIKQQHSMKQTTSMLQYDLNKLTDVSQTNESADKINSNGDENLSISCSTTFIKTTTTTSNAVSSIDRNGKLVNGNEDLEQISVNTSSSSSSSASQSVLSVINTNLLKK